MKAILNRIMLISLLLITGRLTLQAQVTLQLLDNDGQGNVFSGVIFYSGTQFGNASIYAKFGGSGTGSFSIFSPGENTNKGPFTQTDWIFIRPTGSMVVDKSKIIGFTGSANNISGSVSITTKQLAMTNTNAGVSETTAGSTLDVTYSTGIGTFPHDMAVNGLSTNGGFKVQLLDANNNYLKDLINSKDMGGNYTKDETYAGSKGGTRHITATIPSDVAPGTYKVRLVTQGLYQNVIGSASGTFTIKDNSGVTSTPPTNLKSQVCAGETITFNFTTTNDSRNNDNKFVIKLFRTNNAPSGSIITELTFPDNQVVEQSAETGAYVSGSGSSFTRSATYKIKPDLTEGGVYKILVFANNGLPDKSSYSNDFTINIPVTAVIRDTKPVYTIGSPVAAPIQMIIGGTPPWSWSYDDLDGNNGKTLTDIVNDNIVNASAYIRPKADYTFDRSKLINLRNVCGAGTVSGSTLVTVVVPNTPVTSTPPTSLKSQVCAGETITFNFTTTGDSRNNDNKFVIKLFRSNNAPPGSIVTELTFADNLVIDQSAETGAYVSGSGSSFTRSATYRVKPDAESGVYRILIFANNGLADKSSYSNDFTITRPTAPVVANPNPSACQGAPSIQLSASGTNLIWYDSNNRVLPGAPVQSTNVTPDTYIYYVSQGTTGCESERVTIKVTINGQSSPPGDATKEYCKGETAQPLTANGQNLIWYNSSGTQLPQAPTPSTDTPGDQTYKVSQDNGTGCRSNQSTITVRIKAIPTAPGVTTPAPVCQFEKDPPALSATASSGGVLHWFDQSGTSLSSAPKPNTQTDGPINYLVSQNVNGCESTRATITQTIKKASDPPKVSPVLYCRNQVATALTAIGDNLKWYDANDNAITDLIPKTDRVGSTTYRVRQTVASNGCPSTPAELVVTVQDAPDAPRVTAVSACLNAKAPSLSSSVVGSPLVWYTVATGGVGSTAEPTISTSALGTQSVFVAQKVGTCEGPRAELKITINPIPDKPVIASPAAVCEQRPQMVGPFPANSAGLTWYSDAQPNGATQPPTSTTSSPGTYTVAVSQTVNGCLSPLTIVSQTINQAPPKPTASPLLLCKNDADKALSATALAGNVLKWYGQNATGGTASDNAPVISAKDVKKETYYVSQVDARKCESLDRQSIAVEVADKPAAPVVQASQFACLNTTPVALTAGGSNLLWKGSGIPDSTTTAPSPPTSATNVFTYTVVQRFGSCVSPVSTITYTIRPLPGAPTLVSPQVVCVGQPPLSLTANGQNLKWYSTSNLSGTPLPQVTIQTAQSLSTTWYVTQSDGNGCQSAATPLDVRVRAQATARLYGDGQINMLDSTAIRIQFGGDGPWTATLWDDRVLKNIVDNPLVVWVRPLTTRTYALKALSNDCGAGAASNTYEVRVSPVTGIDPAKAKLSLVSSPNPTTGVIQIEWSAINRQPIALRMLSATGQVVWQADRVGTGTVQTESLQMGNWPSGLYFLQLQAESLGLVVSKLVKQ